MPETVAASKNPLIFVLLTVVIDTIGFGVIVPVLPKLIMQIAAVDVAAAASIGGILMVVFAALQFLCGPVIGNLSDRFGRRPVLLSSLLAFSVNYVLMGFAPSLTWLFVGRALTGMAGAVYAPANAYVADITPPDKRAQSFGMIGASFGMGFVLGPALGGFLGELGPRAPFFTAGALGLLNFVYGFFVLPETLPVERRRTFSWARANPLGSFNALREQRRVLGLALAAFFWQLAFQVYPSTWAYYTIAKFNLQPAAIGMTLALSGLSMAFVQGGLTGRIVKRIGEQRAAVVGVAMGAVSFAAYAFMTQAWMLYPVLVVGGLQGLAMPSINAMMSKRIAPERQGELQGAMASLMGLSSIFGPLMATQVLAAFSRPGAGVHFPGAAFIVASALSVVSFTLLSSQLKASAS